MNASKTGLNDEAAAKLNDERTKFLQQHEQRFRELKLHVIPEEEAREVMDDLVRKADIDASVLDVIAIGEKLHHRFPDAQGKAIATVAVMFLADHRGRRR
jgi:hypothetical protein